MYFAYAHVVKSCLIPTLWGMEREPGRPVACNASTARSSVIGRILTDVVVEDTFCVGLNSGTAVPWK